MRAAWLVVTGAPAAVFTFMLWGYHVEFLKNVALGVRPALPEWTGKWFFARRTARLFPFLILISIPGNVFSMLYWWSGERWFLLTQQYLGVLFFLIGPAFALDAARHAGAIKHAGPREMVRFVARRLWALVGVQVVCPVVLVACAAAGAAAFGIGLGPGAFFGSLIWTYSVGLLVRKELREWEAAGGRSPRSTAAQAMTAMAAIVALYGALVVVPMWRWSVGRIAVCGVAAGDSLRYASWKLGRGAAVTDADGAMWLNYPNRGLSLLVRRGDDEGGTTGVRVLEVYAAANPKTMPPRGLHWGCSEEFVRSRWGEPQSMIDASQYRRLAYPGVELLLNGRGLVSLWLF